MDSFCQFNTLSYRYLKLNEGAKMAKKFKTLKLENLVDKAHYASEVFVLLKEAYSKVEGGLLFEDESDLIANSSLWKLAVTKRGEILAVAVFKPKHGQKLVAMAADTKNGGDIAKEALAMILKNSLSRAWMEVSEGAEHFIMKQCGGEQFLMHCSVAQEYIGKAIKEVGDGYHYIREIAGIPKTKIVLGTPGYY